MHFELYSQFIINMLGFIKNISSTEWIIVGLILVVFFGARVVTGLGRMGGETLKEMKKIKKNFTEAVEDSSTDKKEVLK